MKQNNEIAKLQNMEETLNLQRQEITGLNEIVNEMKLMWDKNRQDTMLVNEQSYGHKDPVLVSQQQYLDKNTFHRPYTTFAKYSTPTRIRMKGTLMTDKKDVNRFVRRSEVLINRGKNAKNIFFFKCI